MTFLLRTRGGLTSLLRRCTKVPVLVESPYGPGLYHDLSDHPTLICIAGGVGITAVLALLRSHPGRVKLLWGVRTESLVHAIADNLVGIEKNVFVGKRMSVFEELEKELVFEKTGKNAVVVTSGPGSMCDDARNAVCAIARRKKISVRLVEESFSW